MRKIKIVLCLFLISFLLIICCTGCDVKKVQIIQNKCGKCHATSIVYEKKRSSGEWERIVFGMKARGLKITAAEEEELMIALKNSLTLE